MAPHVRTLPAGLVKGFLLHVTVANFKLFGNLGVSKR